MSWREQFKRGAHPFQEWLYRHPWLDWVAWKLYRARVWGPSKLGHWESEHDYKECPSGERYCIHMYWRLGKHGDYRPGYRNREE